MTDMIEKVALALAHKRMPFTVAYANLSATDTKMLREEAKAAIEAYRSSTDDMVLAAAVVLVEAVKLGGLEPDVDDSTDAVVLRMLQAAADAALEGKE